MKKNKKSNKVLLYVAIGFVSLLVLFGGIRSFNGAVSPEIKQALSLSHQKISSDPLTAHYQLAVDSLRAGKIFKTMKYLKKLNSLSEKQGLSQAALLDRGNNIYRSQLAKNPKDKSILYYQAFIDIAQNNYSNALSLTNQILALSPSDDFAYALKGYLYAVYFKNTPLGLENIQKAISIKPKMAMYQYLLYQGYQNQNNKELANKALVKTIVQLIAGY